VSIVFPNCKINLGLHILRKRNDGYHDLETIFYPIPLHDALEIIESPPQQKSTAPPFTSSGIPVTEDQGSNLCVKAYKLLKRDFPHLPHIQMHLHKVVPSGAGLGGGSADAAFTLQLLNKKFSLNIPPNELMDYADTLGSDCSFFMINKPCYGSQKGEKLEEIDVDLSDWKIVIVNPGIHIDTGQAFREIIPAQPGKSIKEIIRKPVDQWKYSLQNDFEIPIFKRFSQIVEIKDSLYSAGAIYASMSGSGSTVFGIFPKEKELTLTFPGNYFVRELQGKLTI
jgi:4-diphosphocytidyl-2-C-methyl-D-erythritol kinase